MNDNKKNFEQDLDDIIILGSDENAGKNIVDENLVPEELNDDYNMSEELDNISNETEELENNPNETEELENNPNESEELENNSNETEELENNSYEREELRNKFSKRQKEMCSPKQFEEEEEDDDDDVDEGVVDKFMSFKYFDYLAETFRISSPSDWVSSSLGLGMAFMGLFVVLSLLGITVGQFFGGISSLFVDIFPNGNQTLLKIDQSFGGSNTLGLIVIFIPLAILMAILVLYLFEDYIDNNLGQIKSYELPKRLSLYWLVLSIVSIPFLGSFIFSMTNSLINFTANTNLFIRFFIFLVQLIISALTFSYIYKILSKNIFSWNVAMICGFTAGAAFELVKLLFFTVFAGQIHLPITSAFVIGFMMFAVWFFVCGLIFTFGVMLGYYHEFAEVFKPENENLLETSDNRATREIALICLIELTKRFYATQEVVNQQNIGLNIKEICAYCMITPHRAQIALQHLVNVKLVRILYDEGREVIMLNFSPDKLQLGEFIFRVEERINIEVGRTLPNSKASLWFWGEYKKNLLNCFGNTTMKDLYETQVKG